MIGLYLRPNRVIGSTCRHRAKKRICKKSCSRSSKLARGAGHSIFASLKFALFGRLRSALPGENPQAIGCLRWAEFNDEERQHSPASKWATGRLPPRVELRIWRPSIFAASNEVEQGQAWSVFLSPAMASSKLMAPAPKLITYKNPPVITRFL